MKQIKRIIKSIVAIVIMLAMVTSTAFADFYAGDRIRNYNWSSMPTIKNGSSGGTVRGCQQFLLCKGYTSVGSADGSFGPKTTAAVKKYQTAYKLTSDGIVGKNTWAKMNSQLAYYDEGPVNYSYSVDGGAFGDDRFKHQHSASSSQGAVGSWWVEYGSSRTKTKMCS